MTKEVTVVVTGATGKQGGAVTRGLLKRGHKVRAVTRDPNSSQAKSLANAGATLVTASLEDNAAIMNRGADQHHAQAGSALSTDGDRTSIDFAAGSHNAEFFHPELQSRSIYSQSQSSPFRATENPLRLLQGL